jgi:hypothetical protein
MPYLHWQTDSERRQSAAAIKDASPVQPSISDVVDSRNRKDPKTSLWKKFWSWWDRTNFRPTPGPVSVSKEEQERIRRLKLGPVLMQAAALAQAIDFRIEKGLITKYLHERESLHPRRTLDQSYYTALKDTRTRDQDQVVYRATTRIKHDCPLKTSQEECKQCQEDIAKTSRLVVVDQLWMWILDESMYITGAFVQLLTLSDTVITSFPRRWGKTKPDPLSVHKRLRMRLGAIPDGEIRSAYDLGLIIIDECSRVLFDRTRGRHLKPDPINSFADAIREIVSSSF